MDKRAALIISLIMGIIAVLMVKNYVSKEKAKINKGLDPVSIVVAGKNLEKGEILTDQNIMTREYPEKFVGERSIRMDNVTMVLGQKIKNNLEKGRPVLWSDIELDKTEGFASVINPGMRAVTVPVNSLSSISNMIKPGSRVDIILTFDKSRIEKTGEEERKESAEIPDVKDIQAFREYLMRKYSKKGQSKQMSIVLKQNVLVLAVGQKFIGEDNPSDKKNETYSEISLLTSLLGAQEIIHAMTMGQLSFVLRNDADVDRKVVTPSTDDTLFRSAITASISQNDAENEEKAPALSSSEEMQQ